MKKLIFVFGFSIFLFVSCNKKENASFSTSVFNVNHSVLITEDVLLDPWDLLLIDSVLALANDKAIPVMETYTLQGKPINKFLTLGQGPEEVLTVGNLQKNNNSLFVYGLHNKKFLEYDYRKLMNSGEPVTPDASYTFNFIENDSTGIINKLLMGKNFLIAESTTPHARVIVLDYEGNYLKQGGEYPEKVDPMLTDFENARLYASCTVLNEEKTKVALATFSAGMLDIFDISGDKIEKIWGFQDFLPHDLYIAEMGNTVVAAKTNKSQSGYADIAASGKYIYALYSGREFSEENYSYGRIIRVVSWDGSDRYELHTDIDINRLTVSDDDRFIYAISKEENKNPEIVTFDISHRR